MSKTTNRARPKFLITANKQAKLSVQIPQKLSDLIKDYQQFHKEASGEEATLDSLISAFISAALTSDKNFVVWKKERAKLATKQSADLEGDLLETDS